MKQPQDRVENVIHYCERGFFLRTFSEQEFRAHGLEMHVREMGMSFSPHKGTLRGMHYQMGTHAEAKLVRCTRGAVETLDKIARRTFGLNDLPVSGFSLNVLSLGGSVQIGMHEHEKQE